MEQRTVLLLLALWGPLFIWAGWLLYGSILQARAAQRLEAATGSGQPGQSRSARRAALSEWLGKAGFRTPRAVPYFWLATFAGFLLGVLFYYFYNASGLKYELARSFVTIPGGIGEVLLPVAWILPWLGLFFLTALPTFVVAKKRRERLHLFMLDFPLALDLLAALTQAGLGFDAALDRVVRALPLERPLRQELRSFQVDVLAGADRIQAFRKLASRIDHPGISAFVAAVVQAEQAGGSMAPVLRRQAEDLRRERREQAMEQAMAMPVKRLLPMVVCFLPALFIVVLGPLFHEVLEYMDVLTAGARLP